MKGDIFSGLAMTHAISINNCTDQFSGREEKVSL